MLETALDLHLVNWPGALLAGVPFLLNAGILAYTWRNLPRDRLTTVFELYLIGLMIWQAYDLAVRLSATPETAALWRGYLRFGQLYCVPLGLHFATLYAERERVAAQPWFHALLYAPPTLMLGAFQAGVITEELSYSPGWGWLARSQDLGPVHDAHMAVGAGVALATLGVLVANTWRVRRDRERRDASLVLAVGLGIPTLIGVFTEVVLPMTGRQQWPITSTTATIWTVAILVGLTRFQLFQVSTPAAAKAVIEAITDTVMIARADGRLLFVNEQGASLFGFDREHARAHHLRELFPSEGDAIAFFAGRWRDTIGGARFTGLEATLSTPRGPTPFLVSLAPFPLTPRGEPGVAVVAHDVTRMKLAEIALLDARDHAEEANRAKSMFLANMSHELRTPLNAIIGYAELLEEDADPDAAEDLGRIRKSGRFLLDLINDVLDLSKVESGKLEVVLEPVDLDALLRSLVPTVEPLAKRHGNRVVLEVEPGLPAVTADRMRLRQILLNLASNAAKFTENGTVALRAVGAEGRVRVEVSDDGIGMDEAQQRRLFGLFAQVHDLDQRERYGGTGLGLALSKRLAELMGATIDVRSAPGQGSTFAVELARATDPPAPR